MPRNPVLECLLEHDQEFSQRETDLAGGSGG